MTIMMTIEDAKLFAIEHGLEKTLLAIENLEKIYSQEDLQFFPRENYLIIGARVNSVWWLAWDWKN